MPVDRKLGFWMCVALVVGNMIGSGIFLLPASLAPYGMNSVIAWGATAAGALVLAFVFSGLSRAFPQVEGPYAYTRLAFGDLPAFVVAWGYWVSVWVGNAAIATGAVSYLSHLLPWIATKPGASAVVTVTFVWLFTAINVIGVRAAGGVQVATTVLKLMPLLAVAALGVYLALTADPRLVWSAPDAPGFNMDSVTAAATLTLWAFLGFESASVAAQRVIDPERNIPRATMIGTVLTAIIYILACTAVLMVIPAKQLASSTAPFADMAKLFWGNSAGNWLALFAAISGLGALNGWILLHGELPFQMARNGLFPKIFARVSKRDTPAAALCISSVLVTILVLMNYGKSMVEIFTFMILLSTTATLALYLLCALSVLVLLRNGKLVATGSRAAWLAIAGVAGTLYALWTLYGAGLEAVLWGFVLLAIAIPVFYLMRMRRVVPAGQPKSSEPGA
jgi:APA family basic amino acid/polyamine antiporter